MKRKILIFIGGTIFFLVLFGFVTRNKNADSSVSGAFTKSAGNSEEDAVFLSIRYEDCIDGCEAFKNDMDKLIYCQKICDISPTQNIIVNKNEICSEKTGIQRDYCWENKAFFRKNIELCDKITEVRLKRICKNNIMKYFTDGVAPPKSEE